MKHRAASLRQQSYLYRYVCMLCFYRSLLIFYFVFYLYFVFLLLPTWRIKPDKFPSSTHYAAIRRRSWFHQKSAFCTAHENGVSGSSKVGLCPPLFSRHHENGCAQQEASPCSGETRLISD